MKIYTATLPVFGIGTIKATAKTEKEAKDLLTKRYFEAEVKWWELKFKQTIPPMVEQNIKTRIREDESNIKFESMTIGTVEITD